MHPVHYDAYPLRRAICPVKAGSPGIYGVNHDDLPVYIT
jgi:hypothetical protein